ncbi:MAG: hypothetical protein EXS35_16080 [Pedosphaera sp.]|nr:hypothetical protein [Pedosphaera sp.]
MKKTIALLLALAALPFGAHAQSTINSTNHYAWDANAGWIDFRAERPNPGDGIRVTDTFLSGYAWSANTGWINFGGTPLDAIHYLNSSSADFGVNQDGAGNLSGLAWSPNTGWINFGWAASTNTDRPRFDISTGDFSGYAWSANCGWINLGTGLLRTDSVAVTDSDNDGISDAWEREHVETLPALPVLTRGGDYDGDGITDVQEYLLDTDPLVPNAPFRITRISKIPNVTSVEMEWPSSPARIYGVEAKLDLGATNWLFLANVPGAPGTNTIQAIEQGAPTAFFRVAAKLPLQP